MDKIQTYTKAPETIDGILLANTGSPDSPEPADVRRYLAQFLADPRVIEYSRWLWLPILHAIILNTRPRRSARLYRRIWTADGSPLIFYTNRLAGKLETTLAQRQPTPVFVEMGMRYGNPSIASALRCLRDQNASRIIVLPLFPQYSGPTTGSILDAVMAEIRSWRKVPDLVFIHNYHDHPAYIRTVAAKIKPNLAGRSPASHLLLSFHGMPREYIERGDPYYQECIRSAGLIASALDLPEAMWRTSFQSRFGLQEWLGPHTDRVIPELARQDIETLFVSCPGFAVDCLETLDEIGHQGSEIYRRAGGGNFHYIPALNDSPEHVDTLVQILKPYLGY